MCDVSSRLPSVAYDSSRLLSLPLSPLVDPSCSLSLLLALCRPLPLTLPAALSSLPLFPFLSHYCNGSYDTLENKHLDKGQLTSNCLVVSVAVNDNYSSCSPTHCITTAKHYILYMSIYNYIIFCLRIQGDNIVHSHSL